MVPLATGTQTAGSGIRPAIEADAATVAAVEGALAALGRSGCVVREVPDIAAAPALADAHWTLLRYETARAFEHERAHHAERFSPVLRQLVEDGRAFPYAAYEAAQAAGAAARAAMDRVFEHVDALITAAAPGEAPLGHASTGDPILNRVWTLLHVPCITLPLFTGPNGLPLGLQVVARRGADAALLAAARRIGALLGSNPPRTA
jgi:amidase